jgi:hypothetical protein
MDNVELIIIGLHYEAVITVILALFEAILWKEVTIKLRLETRIITVSGMRVMTITYLSIWVNIVCFDDANRQVASTQRTANRKRNLGPFQGGPGGCARVSAL